MRIALARAVCVALALDVAAVAATSASGGPAIAAAFAPAPHAAISVSPAAGGPRTTFTVRFRAPDTTGVRGGWRYVYGLSASLAVKSSARGCVQAVSVTLAPARAGTRLAIRVPAAGSGPWCPGAYGGQVEETAAAACAKGTACPALVRLVGTIGRLRFIVRTLAGAPAPPKPPRRALPARALSRR